MASKGGPVFDYVVIVLIGLGVVVLGTQELMRSQQLIAKDGMRDETVVAEIREDLSSRLIEGVPLEQLTPQSKDEVRARYPFSIERSDNKPGSGQKEKATGSEQPSGLKGSVGSMTSWVKSKLKLDQE